jgi:hypothetical protein
MKGTVSSGARRWLRTMSPRLAEGEYVFCPRPQGESLRGLQPIGSFREDEGPSLICRREDAERRNLRFAGCYRLITLTVHSPLAAVGLLAAVTTALADAGIACNAVSALHHDHFFVPSRHAARALNLLQALARAAGAKPSRP